MGTAVARIEPLGTAVARTEPLMPAEPPGGRTAASGSSGPAGPAILRRVATPDAPTAAAPLAALANPATDVTIAAEENELVSRVQRGDAAAYDVLVRRYMRRAFAVAFRLLGHREDAEDLVQETFMAILRQIDTFQRGRPFGPWMYRILINRGLNARKARSLRRTEMLQDDVPGDDTPDAALERAEVRARFRDALGALPARQRLVIELLELDGFSRAEVADALDISETTVRWHVHDAWHTLRAVLAPLRPETR